MTLTLADLADRSGATPRQLDAWDRNGVLPAGRHPSSRGKTEGQGVWRHYDEDDVYVARTLALLAGTNLQGEALRRAAESVRSVFEWNGRLLVAPDGFCRLVPLGASIDAALAFGSSIIDRVLDLNRIVREDG